MHFGQTLRVLRTTAGVSLRALARQVDVSPAYLSQVETGKVPPPRQKRIRQIESALGVHPGYLLSAAERLDSEVADFLVRVPEAADFVRAAMRAEVRATLFQDLTEALAAAGPETLHDVVADLRRRPSDPPVGPDPVPHLMDYLDEDHVVCLDGPHDKDTLFRALAERAVPLLGAVTADALVAGLWAREREASTGIGAGIAVPHAVVPSLERMVVLLAVVRPAVDYGAVDGAPVALCFLLLATEDGRREHLELLARIAQVCSHPDFTHGVRSATHPADIVDFVRQYAPRIP